MIIGLLLGLSIAVSLTSLIIILTGVSGVLRENMITGAVVGVGSVVSYAVIALVLSLIAGLFFILILRGERKDFEEY